MPTTPTRQNCGDQRRTLLAQRPRGLARALHSKLSLSRCRHNIGDPRLGKSERKERLPWFERPGAASLSPVSSTERQAWPQARLKGSSPPLVFISPLLDICIFRSLSEAELAQGERIVTVGVPDTYELSSLSLKLSEKGVAELLPDALSQVG